MRVGTFSAVALFMALTFVPQRAPAQSAPQTPSPVSLEEYATKNGVKGTAAVQFVSLRCTAIYMFSAGMLSEDSSTDAARKEQSSAMARQYEDLSKRFLSMALQVDKNQDFAKDQIIRMTRMYSDRARAAKANTGNVFDDPILRSDIHFCKGVAENLKWD